MEKLQLAKCRETQVVKKQLDHLCLRHNDWEKFEIIFLWEKKTYNLVLYLQ